MIFRPALLRQMWPYPLYMWANSVQKLSWKLKSKPLQPFILSFFFLWGDSVCSLSHHCAWFSSRMKALQLGFLQYFLKFPSKLKCSMWFTPGYSRIYSKTWCYAREAIDGLTLRQAPSHQVQIHTSHDVSDLSSCA